MASIIDFERVVKPVLEDYFKGTVMTDAVVEGGKVYATPFGLDLDRYGLVDGLINLGNQRITSFASRIQWVSEAGCFNSFTIREAKAAGGFGYDTELAKYLDMLQDPTLMRPGYLVQAYIDKESGELLTVGIVKWHEFIAFLANRLLSGVVKQGKNAWGYSQVPGARFVYVKWGLLLDNGVQVAILTP